MSVQWANDQAQAERIAHDLNHPAGRKCIVEKAQNHHLAKCAKHIEGYEQRINQKDGRFSDIVDRQVFEDREFKISLLHGVYALAEATTRQAETAEALLEVGVGILKALGGDESSTPSYKEPDW